MDKLDANLEQQFDLNLIEAVKMNPVIYDRSHYNYKHFVRKAQTWKQIAETLGVSGKWNFNVTTWETTWLVNGSKGSTNNHPYAVASEIRLLANWLILTMGESRLATETTSSTSRRRQQQQ